MHISPAREPESKKIVLECEPSGRQLHIFRVYPNRTRLKLLYTQDEIQTLARPPQECIRTLEEQVEKWNTLVSGQST
jgi:hypothetical protein